MITENAVTAVPPEILSQIEKLRGEVEKLQRELSMASEVWKTTLAGEKNHFEELLQHKELAWREQEEQWGRQTQAYEKRLEEHQTEFESRLKQMEQNAARALADLDEAWQREKLDWGPSQTPEWPIQRRELERRLQALELENAEEIRLRAEEKERYEARIRELETPATPPRAPAPNIVKALQSQLLEFQQSVASLQERASHSDEWVKACVQALDYQVAVLFDLIQTFAPPAGSPADGVPGNEGSPNLEQP